MHKKILFIVDNWVRGDGRAVVVFRILNSLDKQKYDLSLLVLRPRVGNGNTKMTYPKDVEIIEIEGARFRKLLIPLSKLFLNKKYQIIVTNVLFLTIPIISIAEKISRIFGNKIKIIIVDHVFFDFSNRFFKIKKLLLNRILISDFYRKADRVIGVSDSLSENIRNLFSLKKEKCLTVYNPVIPDNFPGKKIKPAEFKDIKGKIILGVGRLSFQKDFTTLIDAIHIFKTKHKKNIQCFIIGEGDEKEKLKNLVVEYGLADFVHFLGYRDNVFNYMAHADVFVLSSIFEGFGLVLIEAMASRCPVIATDCPCGPKDIVQSGKNGILVPVKDSNAIANAIDLLLYNKNLTKKFVDKGEKYSEKFRFKKIISKYENIFNSI